jgi:hypothetical protein
MAPHLLHAALDSADPQAAVERLVDFLVRTGAHTSYMALLGGSPATMQVLVRLFATSPYLAAHLVGHPELLDSLVRSDRAGRTEQALRRARKIDLIGQEDVSQPAPFRVAERFASGSTISGEISAEKRRRCARRGCLRTRGRAGAQAGRNVAPRVHRSVDLAVVALRKMGRAR